MKLNEQAIQYLEEHFPEMAELATKQAYWETLSSGNSVLVVENAEIIEVFPDGTRQFIKKIAPRIPMRIGQVFIINE